MGDRVAWVVPPISSITEENVMAEMGGYNRTNIRDAWSAYKNTQFEAEEEQQYSCDFYLTEDGTLIELMFDKNDALVGAEFRYEFYDE